MAEGVPTNNQRGRRSGPCRLWGGLDKARHIVPTTLLVRVQCFRKSLHKALQGPSTRPIVVSMINGSYCRRRRRLTIFEPDEMKFGVEYVHNDNSVYSQNLKNKNFQLKLIFKNVLKCTLFHLKSLKSALWCNEYLKSVNLEIYLYTVAIVCINNVQKVNVMKVLLINNYVVWLSIKTNDSNCER